jgi:hypothetical protein
MGLECCPLRGQHSKPSKIPNSIRISIPILIELLAANIFPIEGGKLFEFIGFHTKSGLYSVPIS